jgi:hypothetical protein
MTTQAQTDANRRNSEKSTGPTSAAGKAASRMNALKSGLYANSVIIRGETPDSLDALAAQYQEDYQPQTAGEQTLVDSLVSGAWLLRRLPRVEAHLWERQFARMDRRQDLDKATFLGDAYDYSSMTFSRYQRRYDAVSRDFRCNLKELTRLQAAREKANPPVEAQPEPDPPLPPPPQPPDAEPVNPEIGFVPSNQPAPQSDPLADLDPQTDPQRPAASSHCEHPPLVRTRGSIATSASPLTWKRRKPLSRPSHSSRARRWAGPAVGVASRC